MLRLLLCTLLVFSTWSAVATELERADSALMRGDYAAATEILETLSADGNATAMTVLASLYHRGEGVPRDIDKAVELYLVAAELGQSEAQFNLGNMYLLGEGVPQDESWALSFYRLASKQGHELATQNMRELYRASGGTEPAEPAVASGPPGITPDSPLSPAIAKPADTSVETQPSAPLAAEAPAIMSPETPRPAAEAPERVASSREVGPVTREAPMVTLKPVEARVEAPAQALTSDQSAALRLAKAHGIAVDIDTDSSDGGTSAVAAAATAPVVPAEPDTTAPDTAATATDLGAKFERAERMLALENYAAAIAELTALAAAGHAGSAWRLAALHARGQGVPKDDEMALQWQERAAELGHVEAQFQLGEKYSRGLGVAPDEAMAITYYRAAARGGHVQAREKLRQIYDEAGLPMPELGRRRAPIAITEPVTGEPGQPAVAAAAPVEPLPTISRRDPIENDVAVTGQTDSGASARTVTATAAKTAIPRAEDANPQRGAPGARRETTAAVAAISSPLAIEPEVARADIPQPRLTPDAIVIHPERIEAPADATAEVAPARPANHEVVPGSVLATTDHSTVAAIPQMAPDAAAQATAAAPSNSGADVASPAGLPVATSIAASASDDDLTLLPAVAEEQVADVRPAVEPLETVSQARSVADDAVALVELADENMVVPTAPDIAAAASATGAVAGAAATATESTGNGLFRRIAGLFGDQSGSEDARPNAAEAGLSEQAIATTPPDDSAAAAEAPGEARISEPVVVSAAEPAAMPAEQAMNESTIGSIAGETEVDAEVSRAMSSPTQEEVATQDVAAGKRALAAGDFTGAAEIFSRLAEAGDAEAQAHIGYMHYVGEGVGVDLVRAVDWYRRAAGQGNRDAQYNLAVAYAFGEGVQQNDDDAAIWYRRAAEQGSAIAQYSLGMSYALGEGVPQDDVEATKWYRAAADQGYAAAQYNLGYNYRTGHGVAADEAEAIRWFEAAAADGHAAAQYSLGYMYRSGRGVERDVEEAIKWYRLAAEQGHPDARADLASLNPDG